MNSHPYFGTNLLELERPVLVSLAQNLTRLEKLHLSRVNISSLLPENLVNLSSLTSLDMKGCRLYIQFPIKMFQLPKLEYLNLRYNPSLVAHLPEFQSGSPLRAMLLTGSSFSGSLPVSIGDLASLTELDINGCNLSGFLPYSLSKVTKLSYLDISNNNFKGHIPSLGNLTKLTHLAISSSGLSGGSLSRITKLTKLALLTVTDSNLGGKIPFFLGNLTQLETLHLRNNNFSGQIPTQLMNLKKLTTLDLFSNHLTGPVPAQLKNLTRLTRLDLASNKFNGQLPTSIFDLKTFVYLDVSANGFNSTVGFDSFLKMKNLVCLFLSNNYLSLVVGSSTTVTTQKFRELGLASCNLSTFPYFLQNQDKLEWLDLSYNNIRGQIPKWMATAGKETLKLLDLSHNFLTCFDQHTVELPWSHLAILNLMSNRLQGLLPVPPPSILYYTISNNSLIGEIPPLICNSSSLQILDLSYNNLSGKVPECLCNFSDSLVINLRCNQLEGTIPKTWRKGSRLRMINLSQNKFQGQLPRSMANSTMLESLDVSENRLIDVFPSWLQNLSELKVLILRCNKFHGRIRNLKASSFPKLHIIDLSYNSFHGKLPLKFFQTRHAMKFSESKSLQYLHAYTKFRFPKFLLPQVYNYSVIMTNKGMEMVYERVQEVFMAIDMSSNRFQGEIPESVGNLIGLHLLNFSHNFLSGSIPTSLGNLVKLEALDLSHNQLSGEIPQQLTKLTFLGFFNVSCNHLMGPIPKGEQFNTFQSSSFAENSGLCGEPLPRKCGDSSPSPPQQLDSSFASFLDIDQKVVWMGYGSGLVVGLVIGQIVSTRTSKWVLKTFGIRLYS